jgi:8-oxo-dGTP pyrophosphatase MutT (NUDIX family)
MDKESFLYDLSQTELGGFDAQKIYAPPYRSLLTHEEILAKHPKYAAVNILLYQKNEEWFFPLIVRSHNENDRHSGQISLPGGKKEESDEDFCMTAFRETWEEVGVDMQHLHLLKELSPIYIPPSNFFVYAYLSVCSVCPLFRLERNEVQEIIEIPLSLIKNLPETPELMQMEGTRGYEVPVILYKEYKIWGATSMILSELHHLLKTV